MESFVLVILNFFIRYITLVLRKILQDGGQSGRQSVFSRLNRTCSPLNEPIVLECGLQIKNSPSPTIETIILRRNVIQIYTQARKQRVSHASI